MISIKGLLGAVAFLVGVLVAYHEWAWLRRGQSLAVPLFGLAIAVCLVAVAAVLPDRPPPDD
jgi:hypothetical protein